MTRRVLAVMGVAAAAVAGLAIASPAQATGSVRGAGVAGAVPGSYIVVLKSGAATDAATTARSVGATVTHTYSSALNGFAAQMSERAARRLAAHPAVDYVEQDAEARTTAVQSPTPSWGLDRIDQRALPLNNSYTYNTTASNVTAYIIDTGIRISHTDFGGRATWGTNTVDSNNTDCNGHGTHVAGTVGGRAYGVAKATRLVAVKVLNCAGSGTWAQVINGIDWVTRNARKPAVANMSLGGSANASVDAAVNRSIQAGVTYAVAAGNSNANACNYSPARTPAAITLGATQSNDARASFSNFGTCLDLFAPGVSITSAWNSSNTATRALSGTSMASPHACGVAALILATNPAFTPAQVRNQMVTRSTPNRVTNPGAGSPNRLLYSL